MQSIGRKYHREASQFSYQVFEIQCVFHTAAGTPQFGIAAFPGPSSHLLDNTGLWGQQHAGDPSHCECVRANPLPLPAKVNHSESLQQSQGGGLRGGPGPHEQGIRAVTMNVDKREHLNTWLRGTGAQTTHVPGVPLRARSTSHKGTPCALPGLFTGDVCAPVT